MKKFALVPIHAAGAAVAVSAVPAEAQRYFFSNWRTIGFTTVSSGIDRDRINVRGDARFRAMRLCVFSAPLVMHDVDIRYANGGHQDVNVRQRIRAGTCTRAVDLRGNRRDMRSITLTYSAVRRGFARPIVRVQAR
jgi:hypothetical protein